MKWQKAPCVSSPKACLALGILSIVMGIGFLVAFAIALPPVLDQMLIIQQGTMVYDIWKSPNTAADIYSYYYFFDLQNPEEVIQGKKPSVIQIGPYVYREERVKKDIAFNDNGTVSYREEKAYYFEPSMSAGSENDTFVTVNVPIYGMGVFLRYEDPILREIMDAVTEDFFEEPLFLRLTVHDLLWGYEDKMLKFFVSFAQELKINLPPGLSIFGFFKGRNHSDAGLYTSWTGKHDISRVMQIDRWNGLKELSIWGTKYCNMLNGSDGEFYTPYKTKESKLYFYISDVCRSLYMTYKEQYIKDGLTVYRFHYPREAFASKWENPDNAGFCTAGANETCLLSGLINATSCHSGAPAAVSLPHFYGADDVYKYGTDGLDPDNEEYDAYIDMEPTTAVPVAAHIKMQLNLLMPKVPQFKFTSKLRDNLVYPILWFHESAAIKGNMLSQLKLLFVTLPILFDVLGAIAIVIGLPTAALSAFTIHRNRVKGREPSSLGTDASAKGDDSESRPNGGVENVNTDADERTPLLGESG